jgi:hypothetical protein
MIFHPTPFLLPSFSTFLSCSTHAQGENWWHQSHQVLSEVAQRLSKKLSRRLQTFFLTQGSPSPQAKEIELKDAARP